jgi:hypothetical protein
MKNFLAMLVLAPAAYSVSMIPVYRPLMRYMSLALNVSRHDPWANQFWWDWYGSWIFFGGPFGRWIFGMALGFRILKTDRRADLPLLEQPSLRLFSICALGLIFSLFTLVRCFDLFQRAILTWAWVRATDPGCMDNQRPAAWLDNFRRHAGKPPETGAPFYLHTQRLVHPVQ